MGEINIDSLASCGIVRIENSVGNEYEFKCLIPNNIKEEDVGNYITAILLSIKDKVAVRKSWRFKEKNQKVNKKKENDCKIQKIKPKIKKPNSKSRKNYDKPFGILVADKLKEAGIE